MKASWTVGMDVQQSEEMEREFVASARLRARLRELLDKKIKEARIAVRQKQNYENPAWAYQQADFIGSERTLSDIISLLE